MPAGMCRLMFASGGGASPSAVAKWKPNPIVVPAPSTSGVNDAWSVAFTVTAPAAGAHTHPPTSSAVATIRPLDLLSMVSPRRRASDGQVAVDVDVHRTASAFDRAAEADAGSVRVGVLAGPVGDRKRAREARGGALVAVVARRRAAHRAAAGADGEFGGHAVGGDDVQVQGDRTADRAVRLAALVQVEALVR